MYHGEKSSNQCYVCKLLHSLKNAAFAKISVHLYSSKLKTFGARRDLDDFFFTMGYKIGFSVLPEEGCRDLGSDIQI